MTGLAGLLLTSTHGARSSVMPASAIIAPMAPATAEVTATSSICPERGVAREAAPDRHLQPGDVAALLVGGHDRLAPGLAQARGQVRHPRAVDDVASEQADAAEPALEPSQEPPRCHRPAERGEEAAVDDGVEVHVSP